MSIEPVKVVTDEQDRHESGPLIGLSTATANQLRESIAALRAALTYAGTAGEQQQRRVQEHVRILAGQEEHLRRLLERAEDPMHDWGGASDLYYDLLRLLDGDQPRRRAEAAQHRPR